MTSKLTRMEMKAIYSGQEIRRYRNEECLSQEYVANQLGLAQSTYQRMEAGEIKISMERLLQIANIFKKPISVFIQKGTYHVEKNTEDSIVYISEREWELTKKAISYQEKRIEELEAKLFQKDIKIEQLMQQLPINI